MMEPTSIDDSSRQRSSLKTILAITGHRPDEIRTLLAPWETESATLVLDNSGGRLARARRNYQQIDSALDLHDPDLLLLDCYEIPGAITTALATQREIPLVARLVGDTWSGYENTELGTVRSVADAIRVLEHRGSSYLNAYVFERATGYVAVSTALQDVIRERTGCPPERIGVVPVPMTIDTAQNGIAERARHALGIDQQRVVLTVTNLTFPAKYEGVVTTLEEIRPLLASDPDLSYVVAGDGRFLPELRRTVSEMIEEPGIRERVYLPGFVEDVADLYALADVFAYVSYRDGYPNAVLEAQTARLPVVANAAHGMCDQITDGETGHLVDPNAEGVLRNRVATLLSSPSERRRLGYNARQRVLAENDPAKLGKQLENFLLQFL